LVSKHESPNEKRFENINKSPTILSTIKRIPSPKLRGITGRKDEEPVTNCAIFYYDANIDAVKNNPAKPTLDISKITARKDQTSNLSGFQGFIDNSKVIQAKDIHTLPRQMLGYSAFNKYKGREWVQELFKSDLSNTRIDFNDYLPNSIKRKRIKNLTKLPGSPRTIHD
jgi:hypothetical protein